MKHQALAIAVDRIKKSANATVAQVCSCFKLNRDAWYKYYRRFHKKQFQSSQVVEMVQKRRKILPREGVRKLHHALADDFRAAHLKIGRDHLFYILRQNHMLVARKRSFTKTTNSYHHFHTYNNLIKELQITRPNQVWVSDITYIQTVEGFCYLALITDLYSRKIVGQDVSDSLELAGCLRAFRIAQRQARQATALIHHSDRGVQYCSHPYVNALKKHGILISMTEEKHCYENAVAERVNGILKDEFYLDQCFASTELARLAIKNAIKIYNEKRLHVSLGYKTPESVFEYQENLNV